MKTAKPRAQAEAKRGFLRVIISLPDWLWAELDQAAHDNWRTRNAEVRMRLESTFPKNEHDVIVGLDAARRK